MKDKQMILLFSLLLGLLITNCQSSNGTAKQVQLIIDMDYGSVIGDIDYMGAIAPGHGLMNTDQYAQDHKKEQHKVNSSHIIPVNTSIELLMMASS